MVLLPFACLLLAQQSSVSYLYDGADTIQQWEQDLKATDGHEYALVVSAALVPPRVRQLTRSLPQTGADSALVFDDEQMSFAAAAVFEHLLSHRDCPERDGLAQRLRPFLNEQKLAKSLRHANPEMAFDLIELASWSEARNILPIALTSTLFSYEQQVSMMRRWLDSAGHGAFVQCMHLFDSAENPKLLRACLSEWEKRVVRSDVEFLMVLSRVEEESLAQTARLVWARFETRPELRMQLFEQALELGESMRDGVVRALSRRGPDVRISQWLIQHLSSQEEGLRKFAERFLPYFLPSENIYEEYVARLSPTISAQERGLRMAVLARLPQPEAREISVRWLVGNGWAQGRIAEQIARELAEHDLNVALIESLMLNESVPNSVAMPIARAIASNSQMARVWLRKLLDSGDSLEKDQAARALSMASDPVDYPMLLDLVRNESLDSSLRAAVVPELSKVELLRQELLSIFYLWASGGNWDYEVVSALAKGLIEHGTTQQRGKVLEAIFKDDLFIESEYYSDLKLHCYRSLAEAPRTAETSFLIDELLNQLVGLSGEDPFSDGMPSPREVAAEFPGVHASAQALAACLRASSGRVPLQKLVVAEKDVASAWIHVAQILPPGFGYELATQLASNNSLTPSLDLRLQAVCLYQAYGVSPKAAVKQSQKLLSASKKLRDYPWDLAHGLMSNQAITWVLPADRLANQLVFQKLVVGPDYWRQALASQLLEGYVEPQLLVDASYYSSVFDDGRELQGALIRRALEWDPQNDEANQWLNRYATQPF